VWWSLGFLFTVLMYASFWPSVRQNAAQFTQYIEKLPEAIRNMIGGGDFATPEGYVQTELFSLLGPILLIVYAIGAGARAIAGEEEAGTLDLLLSTPLARRRVVLDTFAAMGTASFALAVLMWLSLVLLGPVFDLRLSFEGPLSATLNLFLLAMVFGTVALLVGTATGSKAMAIGTSSGWGVVTFVLNTLAPTVHPLRPFRFLSPFHYYESHRPLTTGFNGVDILVLAAISAAAVVAALVMFERRDLAT
jgi:ABC-2 type transport system permease protein